MRLDQPGERGGISFLSDMPIMDPCELPQCDAAAGLCHPCQSKIDAVRQDGGEQRHAILGGPAAALVSEAFRKPGPGLDFQEYVGDFHARQSSVGQFLCSLGFVRGVGTQRGYFQLAIVDGRILQSAGFGKVGNERQAALQQVSAPRDVAGEDWLNGNR
jgi:hypothetical protein